MDDVHWRRLTVRILAIRDVVGRLVAYEARRQSDPRLFYEEISQATGKQLEIATGAEPDDPTVVEFQEALQREVDSIVAMAQRVAAEERAKKVP